VALTHEKGLAAYLLVSLRLLRIVVEPSPDNGLRKKSQIMIDKTQTVPRGKIGSIIGSLNPDAIVAVDRALAIFIGIA
jgi:mRNA interferase MazF